LRDAPSEHDAILERAKAELAAGDGETARKDFEAYSQAAPGRSEGPYYLGVLEVNAGEYEASISNLKKALSLDAKTPDAYYYLGQAYYRLGQLSEARETLDHCLSLNQNHKLAQELLSEVMKKQGELKGVKDQQ
jgi:tetratricopeptide (TPR) repeat protein